MSNPYGTPEPGEKPGEKSGDPGPDGGHGQPYSQPYAQPYAQPYGQPGYPLQPGYGQQAYGYAVPREHPKAVTALVLGLVGLIGGFLCGLPLLVSPFAWVTGARARREIDAQPGLGGRGQATAGMITGIIGTVLLVLGVAFVVLIIVLGVTGALDEGSSSGTGANALGALSS